MKYKILKDEFISVFGKTLYRVVKIDTGEKGGFVEFGKNLSQSGDAWVSGNARVFGNAKVFGNAEVFGDARVFGNAGVSGDACVSGNAEVSGDARVEKTTDSLIVGPIGSRDSFVTICKDQNLIMAGCFCGTKKEFLKSVEDTHGDNEHGKNYRRLIDYVFGETQ